VKEKGRRSGEGESERGSGSKTMGVRDPGWRKTRLSARFLLLLANSHT